MLGRTKNLVPKVHPATRSVEPEDPLELVALPVPGDPEVMLQCLVQEYAWMGWDVEAIQHLFRDPCHPALYALWRRFGEEGLRERIVVLLQKNGVFRFRGIVQDEPMPEEAEPELIQLEIRKRPH